MDWRMKSRRRDAGMTPDVRAVSTPRWRTTKVGIDWMRNCEASSGSASVLTLVTTASPAVSRASCSTSGATLRQGPHHGAQKSTNTGTLDFRTKEANTSAVLISTTPDSGASSALHRPQRVRLPRCPKAQRFPCPQLGQTTITPLESAASCDIGAQAFFLEDAQHPPWVVPNRLNTISAGQKPVKAD